MLSNSNNTIGNTWKKPFDGLIKLNVDVEVNDLDRKCSTGRVLRDQSGCSRGFFQVG